MKRHISNKHSENQSIVFTEPLIEAVESHQMESVSMSVVEHIREEMTLTLTVFDILSSAQLESYNNLFVQEKIDLNMLLDQTISN